VGTPLTWADRPLSFVAEGDFLSAINLTQSNYIGEAQKSRKFARYINMYKQRLSPMLRLFEFFAVFVFCIVFSAPCSRAIKSKLSS
jgi:hypothetical protein